MKIPSLAILLAVPRTALILLAGCRRDATVVRMKDLPTLVTQLAAGAPPAHLEEELNPWLLRRFSAIHTPAQTQDTDLGRLGRVQFWDGRAAALDEQATGPIGNPSEMGMEAGRVVLPAAARL